MSTIQTSTFTVLAARYRKGNDGKIVAYLQVQSNPSAPVGYVRLSTTQPPLAGTKVRATGKVENTAQGPVMQVLGDNNIVALTGQQGQILHKTVKTLLSRLGIAHDDKKLENACLDPSVHLPQMSQEKLTNVLVAAGVSHAAELVLERHETFASALTRNFLHGLESIRLPFDVDAKRDVPFDKATWPMDIMRGCMPHPIEGTHGQKAHPALTGGKPFYLVNHVKYDGIDNFFRALSIATGKDDIFPSWVRDSLRPSSLTQCYLDEKQKQGTQIFTGADMKQLERLGLNAPAKIATRLGNMVQLPAGEKEIRMIPLGTYQSSTSLATLEKMEKTKNPLDVQIDDAGLDPFQKKALAAFCDGSPVTLISGPPGTGKSTLISRMIQHAQQVKERIIVLTPTGKSSARLNESFETLFNKNNRPLSITAHALFYGSAAVRKINKGAPTLNPGSLKDALDSQATESFPVNVERIMRFSSYKNGKQELAKPAHFLYQDLAPAELLRGATVFIDESTQITGDMAALILEMKPKRLIMTGDLSQLKPVGSGKPFHDLIHLAKANTFAEQVNFVELQIDHRATKELSDFTRKLRDGQIPLDYVDTYTGDAGATATDLLTREAAVLECKSLDDVTDIVEQIVSRALHTQHAHFTLTTPSLSALAPTAQTTSIVMHEKYSPSLFVQSIVAPSLMTMAYTNAEVSQLNQTVAQVLRPLMVTGKGVAQIPALSIILANGIELGDIILQTENAKAALLYTTPQGARCSSTSMNGEAFVFLGAHTWLPLPSSDPSNIQSQINALWERAGLLTQATDIVASGLSDEPHSHFELFQSLQQQVQLQNSAALQLTQMSLSEALLIDQSKLNPGQPIVLSDSNIKRLVLPPAGPKNTDDPNAGLMHALLQNVWKVDIAHHNSRLGATGLLDAADYSKHYERIMHSVETLMLGNAYTVHKAQGSQAKIAICVVSPPMREDEATNHEASVYTATTRAEKSSYILTHGTTAEKLNSSWVKTRELEATRLSPVVLIAQGAIAPMGSMLTLVTPTPSQHRQEELKPETFRAKAALSSQGLPATLSFNNAPLYLRAKMASVRGNNDNLLIGGIPCIPDMHGIVTAPIGTLSAIKNDFVWDSSMHPANVEQRKMEDKSEEFSAALNDILGDFSF